MTELFILGLAGKARSGKDEAGGIATEFGFGRIAFADTLKHHVGLIFPQWTEEHLYGDLKDVVDPELGFSPRKALQAFGTEFGRSLDKDLWVKHLERQLGGEGLWVITDVRMENEAAMVRKHGILCHVIRPDAPGVEAHSSEQGIKKSQGDVVFINDGSLEAYHANLREYIRTLVLTLQF